MRFPIGRGKEHKPRRPKPAGKGVRYPLRTLTFGWVWFLLAVLAVLVFVLIADGFSLGAVIFILVFAVLFGGLLQVLYRWRAYIAFYDEELEVSTYTFGNRRWTRDNNLFLPYEKVTSASLRSASEIELRWSGLDIPEYVTESLAEAGMATYETAILLRPRNPRRVAEELDHRVRAVGSA